VLREEEIAALLNAYCLLEEASEPAEVAWWALARRLTAFALGTALSRGEILGLRWSDASGTSMRRRWRSPGAAERSEERLFGRLMPDAEATPGQAVHGRHEQVSRSWVPEHETCDAGCCDADDDLDPPHRLR
jgi:hypothetical protein